MAKTPHATSTEVATTIPQDVIAVAQGDSALPAFLQDQLDDIAGLGNSSDQSDSSLPFLTILQNGSPQVKEEDAKFIQDSKPGYIFNTATKVFWPARASKGEDGAIVIPCGHQKKWVEWKPARGGWAGNHEFDIELIKKMGAKKSKIVVEGKERDVITLPNGNLLVETTYTFLLLDGLPIVLGASSSALGPMRDWMSYRRSLRVNGKELPSFAKMYRLQTVLQTKDANSWYNWKFTDIGYVQDKATSDFAKDFAIAVARDEVQIGRPDYFDETVSGSIDERETARNSGESEDIPV